MPGRDSSSNSRGRSSGGSRGGSNRGSSAPRSNRGNDSTRNERGGSGSRPNGARSSSDSRGGSRSSDNSRDWNSRRPDSRTSDSNRPSRRSDDSRDRGPSRRDDRFGEDRRGSGRPGEDRPRRRDESANRGPRRRDDDTNANRGTRGRGDKAPVGRRDSRGGERNLVSEGKSTVQTENLVGLPADIDIKILPRQVLAELRNISPAAADFVSKHLAAALYALEAGDAALAHQHAIAARSRAARLPAVREMCGMAAYEAELWAEALNEFRTYMRLTGDPLFLPLMADCERGLGRPQRALQLARSEQVRSLDAESRLEMRIVASGARRDLGQFDAAVAVLEVPELNSRGSSAIFTRLRYAYAEALLAAGDRLKARDWFVKTALSDVEDVTDASDRALELND